MMALEFNWYNSIEDVNSVKWDQNLDETQFLHSSTFLKIVEKSQINNTVYHYFTATFHDEYVATAVVSIFEMNLDLFVQNTNSIKFIKKIFPSLFKIKLIFCGLPVSSGQSNFWFHHDFHVYVPQFINEISQRMNQLSKQEKIKFQSFKEFTGQEAKIISTSLLEHNYSQCWSLPTINLRLQPNIEFHDYWRNLSTNKRRQINTSLKKIGYNIDDLNLDFENSKGIQFTLNPVNQENSATFFDNYLQVMDRSKVKFETLTSTFFENLFKHLPNTKLLSLRIKKKIVSSFLIVEHDDSIYFLFVSKHDYKDEYDSYFNLMTMLTKYAIIKNKKVLHLGQTTYYTKMRFGGNPEDLFVFFKVNSTFLNFLFKKYNLLLFPKTKL